jgi:hypothetical protein
MLAAASTVHHTLSASTWQPAGVGGGGSNAHDSVDDQLASGAESTRAGNEDVGPRATSPVAPTTPRVLRFLDRALIARSDGVELVQNKPEKLGVVLEPEHPWEARDSRGRGVNYTC